MSSFQMTDSQLVLDARLPSLIESTLTWQRDVAQRNSRRGSASRANTPQPVPEASRAGTVTAVQTTVQTSVGIDFAEEIANTASHAVGVAFSVMAAIALTGFAASTGSVFHVLACVVYSTSAIALYSASTVYHAVSEAKLKRRLQRLDHACIYLFIAGSYTPFLLTALWGPLGWALLAVIWTMAAVGIWIKCVSTKPFTTMSAIPYVAMGWVVVFAIKPLLASLPLAAFVWLVAGGFFYTAGVFYYVRDQRRYNHFIWHLFVLAGSVCHFLSIAATLMATAP